MGDTRRIELTHPVKLKNETVSHLEFRTRIKGSDLQEMDQSKGPMGQVMRLIAALANVPFSTICEMDEVDIIAATEVVTEIRKKLASSPTGASSLPTSDTSSVGP